MIFNIETLNLRPNKIKIIDNEFTFYRRSEGNGEDYYQEEYRSMIDFVDIISYRDLISPSAPH